MSLEPGEVLIQVHALHNTWLIGKGGNKEWFHYFIFGTKSEKYKNENVS